MSALIQTRAREKANLKALVDDAYLLQSPFPTPNVYPVIADHESHYGFNIALFSRTDGGLTFVYRKASLHINTDDAVLMAFESYDFGLTRVNERIFYAGPTSDDRNFAAADMAAGRMGLMALTNSGGAADEPVFIYSDDQAETVSSVRLEIDASLPVGFSASPHGEIYPWPASAGGADGTGWVAFFYSDGVIARSTTIDNGDTWSKVTQCLSGTFTLTEMAVAQIGNQNKWVMLIRDDTADSNAVFSKSTDLQTWSAPVASGIELERNPPYLVAHNDAIWLYAAARRSYPIVDGWDNQLLVTRIEPSEFYESDGATGFGEWKQVAALPDWGTGYMTPKFVNGRWIAAFNAGEFPGGGANLSGGPNAVYMISNAPAAAARPLLQGTSQHESLLTNGDFQVWQNGSSGVGTAGRTMTSDGWGMRRTGRATGYEWSRQTNSRGRRSLRMQRTAGDASTAALNNIAVIGRDDIRPLRGRYCNVSITLKAGADFSASGLQALLHIYSHNTEQNITTTDGTLAGSTSLTTSSTLALPAGSVERTFERTVYVPTDAQMVWVRVLFNPTGTAGADDYLEMSEVAVVPTPYRQPYKPRPYNEELARCQRLFCKTYASDVVAGAAAYSLGALQERARGSEASAAINLYWRFPVEMRAAPTVTVYSPVTGASGQIADVTAAADIAGSAQIVGRAGAVIVNSAATVDGNSYRAHAVAAANYW